MPQVQPQLMRFNTLEGCQKALELFFLFPAVRYSVTGEIFVASVSEGLVTNDLFLLSQEGEITKKARVELLSTKDQAISELMSIGLTYEGLAGFIILDFIKAKFIQRSEVNTDHELHHIMITKQELLSYIGCLEKGVMLDALNNLVQRNILKADRNKLLYGYIEPTERSTGQKT